MSSTTTGSRTILRVDSGADHPGSVSRRLAGELLQRASQDPTTTSSSAAMRPKGQTRILGEAAFTSAVASLDDAFAS